MSDERVSLKISVPAAAFLAGTMAHLNEAKILPPDDPHALQTSAWMEEIEAAAVAALDEGGRHA